MNDNSIKVSTRLGSMLLDHVIMTCIILVFFAPAFIFDLFSNNASPLKLYSFNSFSTYVAILGLSLYFCKDIFNGQSVAKRILKLQIVKYSTGEVASPIQCVVRDIFCILWPIEVIITLNNPNRRLGDRIAGTKVVIFDPSIPKTNTILNLQLVLSFALSYTVSLLLFF